MRLRRGPGISLVACQSAPSALSKRLKIRELCKKATLDSQIESRNNQPGSANLGNQGHWPFFSFWYAKGPIALVDRLPDNRLSFAPSAACGHHQSNARSELLVSGGARVEEDRVYRTDVREINGEKSRGCVLWRLAARSGTDSAVDHGHRPGFRAQIAGPARRSS